VDIGKAESTCLAFVEDRFLGPLHEGIREAVPVLIKINQLNGKDIETY